MTSILTPDEEALLTEVAGRAEDRSVADPNRELRLRLVREHRDRAAYACDDGPDCAIHRDVPEGWQLTKIPEKADPADLHARLGARGLDTISTDPPPPMPLDRLDPDGLTILYGPGGAGKGTLATSWITNLTGTGERVLILDYENHPTEWARRMYGLGGDRDIVLHVAPTSADWTGPRGPIWDQQDEIKALAEDFGATILVVDSLVFACGASDAMKPESPTQYGGALTYIGLPTLSLAHVTKTTNMETPFGSVFWHNLARVTWSMEPKENGAYSILKCRKANNYQRPPTQKVEVTWDDGRPVSVYERNYQESIAVRIADVLAAVDEAVTGLTPKEITEQLNAGLEDTNDGITANAVSHALNRGAKGGPLARFTPVGKTWKRTLA